MEKRVHGKSYLAKFNISVLSHYKKHDIIDRLERYYKFVVVRHPLDRLVSGYKDKLAGNNRYYERGLGRRILQQFRPRADASTIATGKGVTFNEFAQYIIRNSDTINDNHFKVMQKVCYPCQIKYDYIAKLETHSTDSSFIIKEKLSGYGDTVYNVHHTGQGASFWKMLPEYGNLTHAQLQRLTSIVADDMQMFGYTFCFINGTFTAKCDYSDQESGCC